MKTVPSLPHKILLICLSPIIFDDMTLMFSIINFGSLFPDPKGAKQFISLKKSSFKALGEIIVSIYKFNFFVVSILAFS